MSPKASPASVAEIRARLASLAPTGWLPDPAGVEVAALSRGAYHVNFLATSGHRRMVVRQNLESQWGLSNHDQLARELAALQTVEPSGVTPSAIAMLDGLPPLVVEGYVEGRPFAYGPDMDAAAEAIAAVHRCPVGGAAGHLPSVSPEAFLVRDGLAWLDRAEAGGASAAAVAALRRQAARLTTTRASAVRPSIVHTDLIATNLLVRERGCAIVDWEGARLGPAAWDLAYFLSPVTRRWAGAAGCLGAEQQETFLRTYAAAAGVDVDDLRADVRALLPHVVFRALAWCSGFAATASLSTAEAARLRAFTKADHVRDLIEAAASGAG